MLPYSRHSVRISGGIDLAFKEGTQTNLSLTELAELMHRDVLTPANVGADGIDENDVKRLVRDRGIGNMTNSEFQRAIGLLMGEGALYGALPGSHLSIRRAFASS